VRTKVLEADPEANLAYVHSWEQKYLMVGGEINRAELARSKTVSNGANGTPHLQPRQWRLGPHVRQGKWGPRCPEVYAPIAKHYVTESQNSRGDRPRRLRIRMAARAKWGGEGCRGEGESKRYQKIKEGRVTTSVAFQRQAEKGSRRFYERRDKKEMTFANGIGMGTIH